MLGLESIKFMFHMPRIASFSLTALAEWSIDFVVQKVFFCFAPHPFLTLRGFHAQDYDQCLQELSKTNEIETERPVIRYYNFHGAGYPTCER